LGEKVQAGQQLSDLIAWTTVTPTTGNSLFGLASTATSQVVETVATAVTGFTQYTAQQCEEMLRGLVVGANVAYNAVTSVTINTRDGNGAIKPFTVTKDNAGGWPSALARANDVIAQGMLEACGAHKWGKTTGSIFQPNNAAKKLSQEDRRNLRSMALQLFIHTGGCGVSYNGATPEGAIGDNLLSSNEMVKVLRQNIDMNTNWPVRSNYLEMSNGHPEFTNPRDTFTTTQIDIDTAQLSQWHFNQ
jgi:hypothetical protein